MPFAPVEAPTPGPSLLPAQQSSDGLGPQSEPWFISPQPPIASDTLDGDSTPVGEGMPRVIPMPSGDAVRTLSSGQPQGHLTATPRTPERQTDLVKIVHSRPLSAHNGRAIDLLTRPFPSSYVLDGVEHRCNDVTAVRRRSKFKDVFGDIHTQSSASTERTIQLGSDPPVFAGSPQVIPRESAPKKRPVKRSIASNPNVFPNKRGRRDGAAARPAIPDRINLPTQSQSLPAPGNNVETEIVESPEELALCLMDPTWYVVGNGIVPLPPAVKYDGMEEFFDFDQASEGWQDERFWINEDPNRDLEDGPPLTWFRKAEDLSFSLDPWVEGELLMRFPAVL